MRFLVDADLPRRTSDLFQKHGHEALDVRDLGMGTATDAVIAVYARKNRLCLVTGDFDFADIRNYPPEKHHGLVVLELPKHATGDTILNVLSTLLEQPKILERLRGRLAIVSMHQVRLRPA